MRCLARAHAAYSRVVPCVPWATICGARTIGLALVAGLMAFEAVLALGTGAVGIPGSRSRPLPARSGGGAEPRQHAAQDGGESVIAKLPSAGTRRQARRLAADAGSTPVRKPASRTSTGLAEIPLKPWVTRSRTRSPRKPAQGFPAGMRGQASRRLPWDAVEPCRRLRRRRRAPAADARPSPRARSGHAARRPTRRCPPTSVVEGWVKAKATEIKGEERGPAALSFRVLARAAGRA